MEKIEIKKVGINGEGIGYFKKKVCFIPNALPEEEVEVFLNTNNRYYTGEVNKVIKKSPYRIPSKCSEEKDCKGCAFTSLDYTRQLIYKNEIIEDAFNKYNELEENTIELKPMIACNHPMHYKQFVELPIAFLSGKLVVGIYQRDTKYLTVMDHCLLADETINEALRKIEAILNKHHVRDYNDKVKKGLRFIKVRKYDDGLALVFVTGTNGIDPVVTKEISELESIKNIYFSINTSRYQDFDSKGYKKIYGDTKHALTFNDTKFIISIKSELPINLYHEQNVLEYLKQHIDINDKVLSLGCGLGLKELSLDHTVVAIDEKKENIEDAKDNAHFLKNEHVIFKCRLLDEGVVTECKKTHFNTMIINTQLTDTILKSIQKSRTEHLILISNHSGDLMKDLNKLDLAYNIDDLQSFDALPYTAKSQIICCLSKK